MAVKLVCKTCGNDDVKTNMCEKCASCNIDCTICMESFKNNHTTSVNQANQCGAVLHSGFQNGVKGYCRSDSQTVLSRPNEQSYPFAMNNNIDSRGAIENFQISSDGIEYNEILFNKSNYHYLSCIKNLIQNKQNNEIFAIHFNARSLQKNIDYLHYLVTEFKKKPEIIAISETKLRKGEIRMNVKLDGYNFVHVDTESNAGGVGLFIIDNLEYQILNDVSINMSSVENIWIKIKNRNDQQIVIGVIYRHPISTSSVLSQFENALYDICDHFNNKNTELYILGDINIDLTKLDSNNTVGSYANSLISNSLKCLIDKPTRITTSTKSLIDHIYTNNLKTLYSGIFVCDLSDHYGVFVIIPTKKKKTKLNSYNHMLIRDMKSFQLENFLANLSDVFSDFIVSNNISVNSQFQKFLQLFSQTINRHAPLRKRSRKDFRMQHKPWLTRGIIHSINHKNKMYSKFQSSLNMNKFKEYKSYRNILIRTIQAAKRMYYNNIIVQNRSKPDQIWKTIHELVNIKKKTIFSPTKLITDEGKTITDKIDIANNFNEYFANVGINLAKSLKQPKSINTNESSNKLHNSFFLTPTNEDEVSSLISMLNNKKSTRHNDINTKCIKFSKPIIAPVLSDLFNLAFLQGDFPNCLKVAEIFPLFKKGDMCKTSNYRPISLFSQFHKLFEKLILNRLINYVDKYKLLSEHQFGFRKNYSTTLAISNIYAKLINNIDNGLYSCCLFLDLSKAFDTVDHKILLKKMNLFFGIRGIALDLFKSYLTDRYSYTVVAETKSNLQKISCGVPQGSCLGPILFLLYINDMPLASKFDITLFADDTYLILADNDLNTLQTRVNNELNSLNNWFLKHKLFLNYSKTNFLLINKTPYRPVDYIFQLRFNGTSINRVQNIKYLDVYIDELLNWSVHTSYLSLQLAKYKGLFCRLRNYVTRETLVTLYHSLIHSRVQYGVISWGNAANIYLNKIQIRMNNTVLLD